MNVKSPGASLSSDLGKQAKSAWYAYRQTNPISAQDPMSAGLAMYTRGYRAAFFQGVELAGLRPVLERWVELLEHARIEEEFEALNDDQEMGK